MAPKPKLKNRFTDNPIQQQIDRRNAAETQAKKIAVAKVPKVSTADDILANIQNRAANVDPTAVGALGPIGALPGGKPAVAGAGATSGTFNFRSNLAYDFGGVNVQGGTLPLYIYSDPKKGTTGVFRNDAAGVPTQQIIFANPDDPTGSTYATIPWNSGAATVQILNQFYKGKGQIAALKQSLAQRGLLGKGKTQAASVASGDSLDATFLKAFGQLLLTNTQDNYRIGSNGGTQFFNPTTALAGIKGYAGTRVSTNFTYTPEVSAINDVNGFIQENLGRQATKSEVDQYINVLKKYEQDHPDKVTTTTDTLGYEKNRVTIQGASADDKKMLLVGMLWKELQQKGIDPNAISQSGGKIAQDMQKILQSAQDYGLPHIDNKAALNSVLNTLQPGGDINTELSKQKEQAKLLYKPLASYLDSGGTIRDIANYFNNLNQKYLETNTPTDTLNPDIQNALKGDGKNIMSENDYISMLKKKPEWAQTMNAREQASDFATTILKQFGLLA
jgi:hypothetical protein